MHTKSNLGYK